MKRRKDIQDIAEEFEDGLFSVFRIIFFRYRPLPPISVLGTMPGGRISKDVDRLKGRGLGLVGKTTKSLNFRRDTSSGAANTGKKKKQ